MKSVKTLLKRLLYPGLDLHTRSRCRLLPPFFTEGVVDTLDIGCGNGALSYAAYRKGNNVLGIGYSEEDIRRTSDYFAAFVHSERLQFRVLNVYDLPRLDKQFDQVICSEMLEHVKRDKLVIELIHKVLKPGGVLHLCCPNAMHPEHKLGRTDGPEDGSHVRDGYTLESYHALLDPAGFEIVGHLGIGTPALARLDRVMRHVRAGFGDAVALPFFLLMWPFLRLIDRPQKDVPFSIYVKAVKPASAGRG